MISVLMRSHNDSAYIRQTVEALLAQEVDDSVEIISCDDRSTDGTAEYLRSIPEIRHIAPPEGRYVPGRTLNHMVRHANGEYIVFNNADAIPQNREYLKNLIQPLKDDSVNCVFGNQIARPDAFAVVRKDYERAFGDGSISGKWDRFFSLVSSGFRKDELLKKPFNENIQYSEDSEWVNKNQANIVYVPDAIVEHSHNYTLKEVKKRFFNEGIADTQMGKKPITLFHALRNVAAETLRDEGSVIYLPVGHLVYDVWTGKTAVPGGTLTYNQDSFCVNQDDDRHHPNYLTGYLTALTVYHALTGKSVEDCSHSFVDRSLEYYKNGATSNYPAILSSDADMRGLKQLVAEYVAKYN